QRLPGLRPEFLAAVDWALSVQPRERPKSIPECQPRLLAGSEEATRNWQARRLQGGGGYVGAETSGSRSRAATARMSQTAEVRPSRRRAVALILFLLLLSGGAVATWQMQDWTQEGTRRE